MLNLLDDKHGMGNVATRRLSMFRQPSVEEVRHAQHWGYTEP